MKAFEMEAKKELCCIQLVNDLPVLRARLGVSQEEVAEKKAFQDKLIIHMNQRSEKFHGIYAQYQFLILLVTVRLLK